jgi:uncharacterized Rossmann fold enzyme
MYMYRGFVSVLKSFADWWSIYLEIVDRLGIDRGFDELATDIAYELVHHIEPSIDVYRSMIMGRNVIVLGAGPNLENHIELLERYGDLKQAILIAADGVTKALVDVGVIPHIISSDLDGDLEAIFYAVSKGSKIFIHVHGDNIAQFISFIEELKKFSKNFVVTTQVEPRYPILNFGGFTDGDRAYAIAIAFRPSKVLLAGMDFGTVVGRYSKPWLKSAEKASMRKQIKLLLALKIVSILACISSIPTYTLSEIAPTCVKRFAAESLVLRGSVWEVNDSR